MPDATERPTETSEIELTPHEDGCFALVLPNPGSTGHLWQVEASDGVALVGVARASWAGETDDMPIGGGFDETYTLTGMGTITMVLRRPWEKGAAPWKRVTAKTP
jgi:predicted secreted protein